MVRGCAVLPTGLGGSAVSGPDAGDLSSAFAQELRNFQEIAHWLMPEWGEVPRLAGLDVWGSTRALRGAVGGDHLIYVDFKQRYDVQARIAEAEARGAATVVDGLRRCSHRAGIAVLDAAGHQMTDALLAAMIHQAFLLGALYELELVRPADAVRPVGADPEPHHVGDDQQRQVSPAPASTAGAGRTPRRGPRVSPCTPRRSGGASRRRPQPSPSVSLCAPRSQQYVSPDGSASAGVGSSSRRHKSMKCSCDAERSFSAEARHFVMKA